MRIGSGMLGWALTAPVTDPAPFLADPGRIGRGRPLETPARPPER